MIWLLSWAIFFVLQRKVEIEFYCNTKKIRRPQTNHTKLNYFFSPQNFFPTQKMNSKYTPIATRSLDELIIALKSLLFTFVVGTILRAYEEHSRSFFFASLFACRPLAWNQITSYKLVKSNERIKVVSWK